MNARALGCPSGAPQGRLSCPDACRSVNLEELVVTPQGKVSHYFFGLDYSPFDVRLALVDASKGKLGSLVDHILLLCMHYDPVDGQYGFWIIGALRIAGVLTVAGLALFMLRSLRRERDLTRAHGT